MVDRVLGPLLDVGAAAVGDRVQLCEARALSGRTEDAAVLVAGLPVGEGPEAVSRGERARLWLLAGHPGEAAEEAQEALSARPEDTRARLVLGRALARLGRAPEGLGHLSQIAPGSPEYAEARVSAAEALSEGGVEDAVVDLVLERAQGLARDALARDRLRLARATLRLRGGGVGAPGEALAGVETVWGRHRRGALLAPTEPPSRVLEDLQARTGELYEDAQADAWVVLVARLHPEALAPEAVSAALARAREGAPEAAVTQRAEASQRADRREATELLRRAWALHRAR
jgi:tetratricopeptide (TPR) repeat protein